MTSIHQGSIILTPPSLGPMIAHTTPRTVQVRLGHDDTQGRPLLVGALPANLAHTPEAVHHTLYTPWADLFYAETNSCVGMFSLDLPWHQAPNLTWLFFLVLAQPAGLGSRPGPVGHTHFAPLATTLARFTWMKGPQGARPDPTSQMTTDIDTALTIWLCDNPATRLAFAPLKQPDEQHLLTVQNTAGAPLSEPTRFVFSSCQYPAGMLDHTPARGRWRPSPSDKSLAAINQMRHRALTSPDFVLLVGDQVYIDETAGLFDPALSADRYGAPYNHWLSQPMAQKALSGLPVHTMLDDHEITDNWEPLSPDAQGQQPDGQPDPYVLLHNNDLLLRGVNSYQTFQSPSSLLPTGLNRPPLWRQVGPANRPDLVFLADTRTERTPRHAGNIDSAEIMGETQFSALIHWLAQPCTGPRFVACPAMALPRRRWAVGATPASALYTDAWDGYPHSLHRLLAALHQHQCRHVILLSGDEHLASISMVDISSSAQPEPTRVHLIHTAGLHAPFPFANARPSDFLHPDTLRFADPADPGNQICCDIQTWFAPPGDGFVSIEAPMRLTASHKVGVTLMLARTPGTLAEPHPDWLQTSSVLDVAVRYHAL